MDESTKRRVKFITIITIILLVLAIVLVIVKNKQDKTQEEGGNLPDIGKANYSALQNGSDDFTALDEATNNLG